MRRVLAGYGSFGFESASNLIPNAYGHTVDDAAPVVPGKSVSGLVTDNEDWNFEDI